MSSNTKRFNLYDACRDFVRNITKGRYYLKDFEQMGAKVICTPHKAKSGRFSCFQASRIYIDNNEYFVVAKCTPIHSCYIHHVNNIKYASREEQIRKSRELISYYNTGFAENRNGVRRTVQKRNFFTLFSQLVLTTSVFMGAFSVGRYFIVTHRINDLLSAGLSGITILLSIIMIAIAIKDKPRISK